MKKTIAIILLAGMCAMGLFLYRDWLTLMHTPREDIQAAAGSLVPPPAYSLAVRQAYPPLFDVAPPAPLEPETTDMGIDDGLEEDQYFDASQLQTPAGLLRVRAIFTRDDTRIALLESLTDKSATLLEVRKNDTVHGYRVIEAGSNHIRLSPEGGGDSVKLVIFDRKDPTSEIQSLPETRTESSIQLGPAKHKKKPSAKRDNPRKPDKKKNAKDKIQKKNHRDVGQRLDGNKKPAYNRQQFN